MQTPIPCLFMRGGTSRGPFFKANDLPADLATRDKVLLAVMGSPDKRQIDGLGGVPGQEQRLRQGLNPRQERSPRRLRQRGHRVPISRWRLAS